MPNRPPPVVLMAWELGAGTGHARTLARLAARLRREGGVRVVAALRDLSAAPILVRAGAEAVQAPVWPAIPSEERPRSSATLTDVLAASGLDRPETVRAMIAAWRSLLAWIRPSLLVTDFAPAAALAARGRMPVLQAGFGYGLPPAHLERLPTLHDLSRPLHREEAVLGAVNGALRALGDPRLARLAEMFDGDAVAVTTFPLLDPFAGLRAEPALGPLVDAVPPEPDPEAAGAFAYLGPAVMSRADVTAVLRALAPRLELHAPGADPGALLDLAGRGALVHGEAPPLHEVLPWRRLVIHGGGAGVAAEALAAGVPQLVLASHVEQRLNGLALERAGAGRLIALHDPAAGLRAEAAARLEGDDALLARARALGREHRGALLARDPLAEAARRALALLARGPRPQ